MLPRRTFPFLKISIDDDDAAAGLIRRPLSYIYTHQQQQLL